MKVKGLKKYLFLFFSFLLVIVLMQVIIKIACNFITGNFINEMSDPSSIKNIDIHIANSKKYYINFSKLYYLQKGKANLLIKNIGKKFKADIKVNYAFGSCSYPAKIWQNGD